MTLTQIQPENLYVHFLWIALPIILTVVVSQWLAHRSSVKEAEKREQKLGFVLTEHPPHSHGEYKDESSEGPLRAENIKVSKISVNGH